LPFFFLSCANQPDPRAPPPSRAHTTAFSSARLYPYAITAAHRALALDSTFKFAIWTLGVAEVLDRQRDSAVATLEWGTRLHPDDAKLRGALVFAYAAAERWPDAERERAVLRRPGGDLYGGTDAAFAEMVFGDREPLLRLLTSPEGQRRFVYPGGVLGCDPLLDPLRSDARFRGAMLALGVQECTPVDSWPIAAKSSS
jgi:hypothetical protein